MQLHKQHRQQIQSLSKEDLDADAQLARLLATVLRDEKHAEGVMLFYQEKVKIYNKEKKEKAEQQKKLDKEAEQKPKPDRTWKDIIFNIPTF